MRRREFLASVAAALVAPMIPPLPPQALPNPVVGQWYFCSHETKEAVRLGGWGGLTEAVNGIEYNYAEKTVTVLDSPANVYAELKARWEAEGNKFIPFEFPLAPRARRWTD